MTGMSPIRLIFVALIAFACCGCTTARTDLGTAGGSSIAVPTSAVSTPSQTVTVTSTVTASPERTSPPVIPMALPHPQSLTANERSVAEQLIATLTDEMGGVAIEGDTVRLYGINAKARSLDVAIGRLDGENHNITAYWIRDGRVIVKDLYGGDDVDVTYNGVMARQYAPDVDLLFHWHGNRLVK